MAGASAGGTADTSAPRRVARTASVAGRRAFACSSRPESPLVQLLGVPTASLVAQHGCPQVSINDDELIINHGVRSYLDHDATTSIET